MKKLGLILIFAILIGGVIWAVIFDKETDKINQSTSMAEVLKDNQQKKVRLPAVAGQFYPSDKAELVGMINQFLNKVELSGTGQQIKGLIVPHAGYVYSGQVAAYGFKAIQGKDIKRVILIGSSHQQYLNKAVIDDNDVWQTPLGQIDLDVGLKNALIKENPFFTVDSGPHQSEHSLEVELPFLQAVLTDFKLLPILVGHQLNEQDLEGISQSIAEHLDDKTLIIVSSDMSHYPAYEKANYTDKKVIEAILTGQISELRGIIGQIEKESISNLSTCLCGQAAVETLMKLSQEIGETKIELLKYNNSGDISFGDKERVVGYGAISFAWQSELADEIGFSQEQKDKLLEIARESVKGFVKEKKAPTFSINDKLLNKDLGAFVTLRKDNQLRGCIGLFEPNIPLYQVVSQMAIAAATQDNRFYPVRVNELDDLDYEISVLSHLRKIDDWREIEVGRHGVKIVQGLHSGVFLPQVATENNWGLEEFMNNLCQNKAGLSSDVWKKGEADIYIFTAEVFGED